MSKYKVVRKGGGPIGTEYLYCIYKYRWFHWHNTLKYVWAFDDYDAALKARKLITTKKGYEFYV